MSQYNNQNSETRHNLWNNGEASRRANAPRRAPEDKDDTAKEFYNILTVTSWPLFVFYLEITLKLLIFGHISGRQFAYTVLFSFSAGLICSLFTSVFQRKTNYYITLVISGFLTVYFNVQLVYYKFFSDFFYWDLMGEAGNVTAFWRETVATIFANWYGILLLFLPFVLYCIFGKKHMPAESFGWGLRGIAVIAAFCLIFVGVGFISTRTDDFDDRYYYRSGFTMKQAVERFGMMAALRLDTHYSLFGKPSDIPYIPTDGDITTLDPSSIFSRDTTQPPDTTQSPDVTTSQGGENTGEGTEPVTPPETTVPPKPIDTSPQILDIDFDKLIATAGNSNLIAAHQYFMDRPATKKNEYTGLFAGKNVIFMTVEAWAPAAIDERFTPTLYKMKNEGFVFNNFYCSCWGGSTATGEYANMTGNYYRKASCIEKIGGKLMKFALGNMLTDEGYDCYGFHNHSYTYYSRNISHPNMGLKWFGIGNWDKSDSFTSVWPKSDRELAVNTLDYIKPGKPFHFYYMTVSGHALQTFTGNNQAKKHKAEVYAAGLNYTDVNALSYIASEYEVELMVKTLCDDLAAKGLLDDTVFVMAPDHYPYQITEDANATYSALADLYKLPADNIESNFDLYRAPLIIWSPSMTAPVEVNKVCSAIDILPTVLNLFGLKYDSRLLMGQDILSDSEGFVVLNCNGKGGEGHFITDWGSYSAKTRTFTPAPGVTADSAMLDAYVKATRNKLLNMNTYSPYILDNDYYRKVFPNG